MNEIFYEKYSKKSGENIVNFVYSHKYQRNISILNEYNIECLRFDGGTKDYYKAIYARENTELTESDGEFTDDDLMFCYENTTGSDADGEATDDDEIYCNETTGTRADGENENDEYLQT